MKGERLGGGEFSLFARLLREGAIRGMHAYGVACSSGSVITRACFHKLEEAQQWVLKDLPKLKPKAIIGHCRYSTSGDYHDHRNNQPILAAEMALAFNGVISMKLKAEFEAEFGVKCLADNDGEIFLRKLEQGQAAEEFLAGTPCSFAGAWLNKHGELFVARNEERPLHRWEKDGNSIYCSTEDIGLRAGLGKSLGILTPGVVCG